MTQHKSNFIMTNDESTANKLMAVGFKFMSKSGGNYVFLNNPPKNFNFEKIDLTKINYTNMLMFK